MYLNWKVSGNVVITITGRLGPMPSSMACSWTAFITSGARRDRGFLRQDTTTQGSWVGTYGAQGYDIVSGPSSLPSNDTVTPSGQSTYTWTTTSSDPRALQVPGSSNRVAAVWYSSTSFTVDVNLADGQAHDLELYFDDWDNSGRSEQVQISDAGTGTVLDTETISSFSNGVYLDWKVSGNVVITITRQAGANAVLNGVFLDSHFIASAAHRDREFPQAGHDDAGELGRHLRRAGLRHRLRPVQPAVQRHGHAQRAVDLYLDTTTSSDPRALQVPGSSNRVAAVWYSATSFTVDVNLADGQTHDLELYFDDWDNKGRSEQVQISDAGTGTVLDTETISSFSSGVYLDWKVSGNLVITITRQAGANAVLNGLFLDSTSSPPSTATASFLKQDATTQGSWVGTYGAQGYDIVSGPSSLPANDTVTPSGQSTYTWTTTSSDPRALQVPGSSNRVAAVWYSATSFTVDVNLADGQTHDLELYFDDWDNKGRGEQVQISDAGTGTVLDTETISSFGSGVYLDWKVSGNLVITITRQAGANAVLNGLFLGSSSSPPIVTGETPAPGAANVSVSGPIITATFSEPVQAGSIHFTLTTSTGSAVAGTTSYSSSNHTVKFTPNAALASGTTYKATVSGAKDTAGDPMSGSVSCSFTTATSSPTVNAGLPITVNAGATVTFSQATESGGTAPVTYTWTFGDGTQQFGSLNPAHSYANPGSYTATVTVTDANNLSSSSSVVVTVNAVAPTASINVPSAGTVGVPVSFSASAADPSPVDQMAGFTYNWNFGDGTTGTGVTPVHIYSSAGTYTVSVDRHRREREDQHPGRRLDRGQPPPVPADSTVNITSTWLQQQGAAPYVLNQANTTYVLANERHD